MAATIQPTTDACLAQQGVIRLLHRTPKTRASDNPDVPYWCTALRCQSDITPHRPQTIVTATTLATCVAPKPPSTAAATAWKLKSTAWHTLSPMVNAANTRRAPRIVSRIIVQTAPSGRVPRGDHQDRSQSTNWRLWFRNESTSSRIRIAGIPNLPREEREIDVMQCRASGQSHATGKMA